MREYSIPYGRRRPRQTNDASAPSEKRDEQKHRRRRRTKIADDEQKGMADELGTRATWRSGRKVNPWREGATNHGTKESKRLQQKHNNRSKSNDKRTTHRALKDVSGKRSKNPGAEVPEGDDERHRGGVVVVGSGG